MRYVIVGIIFLFCGLAAGLALRSTVNVWLSVAENHQDDHSHGDAPEDDHHDHGDEEEVVALSKEAFDNLKIRMSEIELSDYTKTIRVPGEVVEIPGVSARQIAAPLRGVITEVFVSFGQTVKPGERLFEIRIVDDELTTSQVKLLQDLTRLEIVDAEIARLSSLAASGAVAGRKKIELEYEKKELSAALRNTQQELLVRGLPQAQIDRVRQDRELVSKITVRLPETWGYSEQETIGSSGQQPMIKLSSNVTAAETPREFTVEKLLIEPGQSVDQGTALCHLAAHSVLAVLGHAVESEIDLVSDLARQKKPIWVEFGIDGTSVIRDDLQIQYVSGHINHEQHTFGFYVLVPNELMEDAVDPLGRQFRMWRFKVGQRVHIHLPWEVLRAQIVLPREAIAQEGADTFVFREHKHGFGYGLSEHDHNDDDHSHDHGNEEDDHEEVFTELEPVPVQVVYQDKRTVVLAPGGELQQGDEVAVSSAYQLLLAMRAEAGGGGHGHHHDH